MTTSEILASFTHRFRRYSFDDTLPGGARPLSMPENREPDAFDARWGTHTTAYPDALLGGVGKFSPLFYEPPDPGALIQALSILRVEHSNFIFLDLAAGKGRSLILASTLPFKHIIGVEIAYQFVEIACANLRICGRSDIEIVNKKASRYIFPAENLVVLLFHPFGRLMLNKMLAKIAEHSAFHFNKEIYLISRNPLHPSFDWPAYEFARPAGMVIYHLPARPVEARSAA